jgi:hypothetical protein
MEYFHRHCCIIIFVASLKCLIDTYHSIAMSALGFSRPALVLPEVLDRGFALTEVVDRAFVFSKMLGRISVSFRSNASIKRLYALL